jgi:hypothetical protein
MIYAVMWAVLTAVALVLVYRSGSPGLIRSGWVMAGNMALVWVGTWWFDEMSPWRWFIVIDLVSAFAIVVRPSGRLQSYIGGIYAVQVVVHLLYGFGGASIYGERAYLDLLAFGGGCQLLILATGAIHGRGRKVADPDARLGGAGRAGATHPARVEAGP